MSATISHRNTSSICPPRGVLGMMKKILYFFTNCRIVWQVFCKALFCSFKPGEIVESFWQHSPHKWVREMITVKVVRKLIHPKMNGKHSLQKRKGQLDFKLSCSSRTPTLNCSHTAAVKIYMTIFPFVIGTMNSESFGNCQVLQSNQWHGHICSGSWEAELNAKSCFALFDLEVKLFSSLSKGGEGGERSGEENWCRHLCVLQSFLRIRARLVATGAWSLENCCFVCIILNKLLRCTKSTQMFTNIYVHLVCKIECI